MGDRTTLEIAVDPKSPASVSKVTVKSRDKVKVALVVLTVLFACATIALAIALGITLRDKKDDKPTCGADVRKSYKQTTFTPTEMEMRGSIFYDLSVAEVQSIVAALEGNGTLGLVKATEATVDSNYIAYMERFAPEKAAALAYLDGTSSTPPPRFARVIVHRGGDASPTCVEYKVGPLGSASSAVSVYKTIPFSKRSVDDVEYGGIEEVITAWAQNQTNGMPTILAESFNATYEDECAPNCLTWTDTAPRAWVAGKRQTWAWFMRDVDGVYLHPVGLEILIDHLGKDVSQWKVITIMYNNIKFDSTEEFVAAYNGNTVPKIQLVYDETLEEATSFRRRGTPRPLEHLPPPSTYEPAGPRFVINDMHVDYLGWSFNLAVRQSAGPQLWDIRFKGERIIYELSLQEAFASYGGISVISANSIYTDTAWGLGRSLYEMIPGVDCPFTGKLLDIVQYSAGETSIVRYKNAICVFEHADNMPLRRHYDSNGEGGFNWVSSVPGSHLVVRMVSTVYNYDYMYDFALYPNGVVEASVHAAGYLQAVPYLSLSSSDTKNYGNQILNYTAGAVHDHIVLYKIDLDIQGTANTPEVLHIDRQSINLPYMPIPFEQRVITPQLIADETVSRLNVNGSRPAYWTVRNTNAKNKWNVPRAYRIMPMGTATTVVPDFAPMGFVAWTKYNMAFTQYHDDEFYGDLNYDQEDPFLDAFSFDDYFNGESLVDQDVVAWASIGMQHIPSTEDVPNTNTPGNGGKLVIRPYNYFDEDPSMDLLNAVMVRPGEDGAANTIIDYAAEYNGMAAQPACVAELPAFTFDGMLADE